MPALNNQRAQMASSGGTPAASGFYDPITGRWVETDPRTGEPIQQAAAPAPQQEYYGPPPEQGQQYQQPTYTPEPAPSYYGPGQSQGLQSTETGGEYKPSITGSPNEPRIAAQPQNYIPGSTYVPFNSVNQARLPAYTEEQNMVGPPRNYVPGSTYQPPSQWKISPTGGFIPAGYPTNPAPVNASQVPGTADYQRHPSSPYLQGEMVSPGLGGGAGYRPTVAKMGFGQVPGTWNYDRTMGGGAETLTVKEPINPLSPGLGAGGYPHEYSGARMENPRQGPYMSQPGSTYAPQYTTGYGTNDVIQTGNAPRTDVNKLRFEEPNIFDAINPPPDSPYQRSGRPGHYRMGPAMVQDRSETLAQMDRGDRARREVDMRMRGLFGGRR